MSKILFELLFCIVGLLCCWHFTRAGDMRSTRWIKLGISAPLFFLIARVFAKATGWGRGELSGGDIHVFFIILLLAIIWTSNISWSIAGAFTNFFYGASALSESMRPEYRYVYSHLRDRDFDEALKLVLIELEKHPRDYEGLMIASSIYQELKLPRNAMLHLKTVLENSESTDAQKSAAQGELTVCEQMQRHIEIRQLNES